MPTFTVTATLQATHGDPLPDPVKQRWSTDTSAVGAVTAVCQLIDNTLDDWTKVLSITIDVNHAVSE